MQILSLGNRCLLKIQFYQVYAWFNILFLKAGSDKKYKKIVRKQ